MFVSMDKQFASLLYISGHCTIELDIYNSPLHAIIYPFIVVKGT